MQKIKVYYILNERIYISFDKFDGNIIVNNNL